MYLVVGWSIGLRFTRESFAGIAKSLPQVFAAIVALVLGCAGIGWALGRPAHIDPLTAYLATNPGGADSIAILAAGTPIDVPFVMAAQSSRFLAVLLLGLRSPSAWHGSSLLAEKPDELDPKTT